MIVAWNIRPQIKLFFLNPFQLVYQIHPLLHHDFTLLQVLSLVGPYLVALGVRQLAFY